MEEGRKDGEEPRKLDFHEFRLLISAANLHYDVHFFPNKMYKVAFLHFDFAGRGCTEMINIVSRYYSLHFESPSSTAEAIIEVFGTVVQKQRS